MLQLSQYIHQQIQGLRRTIQNTPPKKQSSLAKIQALVNTAPLPDKEKVTLTREISQVQRAITVATTPPRKHQSSPITHQKHIKSHNKHPGPQDYLTTRDLIRAKLQTSSQPPPHLETLQLQFQTLRASRLHKQKYLQELIIKVQRLQRMHKSRTKSSSALKHKQQLNQKYKHKQDSLRQIKEQTLTAAKQRRKVTVHALMNKYVQRVEQLGR